MGEVGCAVTAAACAVLGAGVSRSGSGWLMGVIGVSHLYIGVALGAMGGQVGSGGLSGCGAVLVVSVSRPRSNRSWAAGGCVGCRYHASSNVACTYVCEPPLGRNYFSGTELKKYRN